SDGSHDHRPGRPPDQRVLDHRDRRGRLPRVPDPPRVRALATGRGDGPGRVTGGAAGVPGPAHPIGSRLHPTRPHQTSRRRTRPCTDGEYERVIGRLPYPPDTQLDLAHLAPELQTKASMTTENGRAFNEWLRAQLKAKKMSQRQLAQQSGVDHSTISRLVRGDRMPSLGTATKLARGLRELGEGDEGPQYLGLMGGGVQNPTARIEYALRADEALSESQVRQVMEYYLAVRMRRIGSAFSNDMGSYGRGDNGRPNGPHLPPTVGSNGIGGPIVPRPSLVSNGRVATAE